VKAKLSAFISKGEPELGEPVLIELFNTIMLRFEECVVVVDGFDKCPVAEQCTVIRLINSISAAATSSQRFKVFIAYRAEIDNDVWTTFASHHQFTESRRHVDADITAFVEETLQMKIS
jgi:hypothetical protein